jgi:hypothetical protein
MSTARMLTWPRGLAVVLVGFIVIVAVMVVVSLSQRVDLVADDYYERSLRHEQRMGSAANAQSLGEGLSVRKVGDELVIAFPPTMQPAGIAGLCVFYRPSDRLEDRRVVLQPDASGAQRIALETMARGLWKAQLSWQYHGEQYYLETPIILE